MSSRRIRQIFPHHNVLIARREKRRLLFGRRYAPGSSAKKERLGAEKTQMKEWLSRRPTAKRGICDGKEVQCAPPVATFPITREAIANARCRKFPTMKLWPILLHNLIAAEAITIPSITVT
jgi:hypothetical protein